MSSNDLGVEGDKGAREQVRDFVSGLGEGSGGLEYSSGGKGGREWQAPKQATVSYFSLPPFLHRPPPPTSTPVACLAWESSSTWFKTECDSDPSG